MGRKIRTTRAPQERYEVSHGEYRTVDDRSTVLKPYKWSTSIAFKEVLYSKKYMLNSKFAILTSLFNFVVDSKLLQPLSVIFRKSEKISRSIEAYDLIHCLCFRHDRWSFSYKKLVWKCQLADIFNFPPIPPCFYSVCTVFYWFKLIWETPLNIIKWFSRLLRSLRRVELMLLWRLKDFVFISRTDLKSEDATPAEVHFTWASSLLTQLIRGRLG